MACAICNIRREKRHCPGVRGEICAICCGEQREETISCPFDCEYLRAARDREDRSGKDPAKIPNPEFRVSSNFINTNFPLIASLQEAVFMGALQVDAVDDDVKEALEGLDKTYKTLGSGLYYESRPTNPLAAGVYDAVQQRVAEIRQKESERGIHRLQDSQIHSVLMFLGQMEYALNNGRKRGRAYLDGLRETLEATPATQEPDAGSLIVS